MNNSYELISLQNATTLIGDGLHGTPEYDNLGDYYFINGNNLNNGKIQINSNTKKINKYEYIKHKKNINDRTILVSINGTLGNIAFYNNEKVILGKSACYLNVNESINKYFVSYILQSKIFQNYIHNLATGSTIKNVSLKLMRDFKFILPSRDTQEKIVHVLHTLDKKIDLLRETNQTLESIAQAIFKSWFVDFDPVHAKQQGVECAGIDKATADLFPNSFIETELGLIPKDWSVGTVGKMFSLTMGQSPAGNTYNESGDGMEFYQGRTDFGFRFPSQRIFCNAPTRIAKENDILISVRAPVGDVNVALNECCIGRGVAAIRHPKDYQSYALYSMKQLSSKFKVYDGEGTVFGSINKTDFENITLISPHKKIILTFEKIIESFDKKIKNNELILRNSVLLRDTLLPRLISGKLDLSNIEEQIEGVA